MRGDVATPGRKGRSIPGKGSVCRLELREYGSRYCPFRTIRSRSHARYSSRVSKLAASRR
jgi:hypothetical protein